MGHFGHGKEPAMARLPDECVAFGRGGLGQRRRRQALQRGRDPGQQIGVNFQVFRGFRHA